MYHVLCNIVIWRDMDLSVDCIQPHFIRLNDVLLCQRADWRTQQFSLEETRDKKKVRDLILEVTHHEISEKPQFMAYDAAWQRRTDYSRKSVAFEPDSWAH